MPPSPLRLNADDLDLSGRLFRSGTVAASPTGATETTVCTLTITPQLAVTEGILLFGYLAFTAGTDGASAVVRLRQTNTSGSIVKASGAVNVTAASLYDRAIAGFDTGPTLPGQVYVLTLTVASATAGSTVSAAELVALVV